VHGAGADALVGGETGALEQVEGLAPGDVGVGVDQADRADGAAALQGVGGHAADQAAAADDADFHDSSLARGRKGFVSGGFSARVPGGLTTGPYQRSASPLGRRSDSQVNRRLARLTTPATPQMMPRAPTISSVKLPPCWELPIIMNIVPTAAPPRARAGVSVPI